MYRATLLFPFFTASAVAATCEPYSHEDWRAHMAQADEALTALDRVAASEVLDTVRSRMRCLNGVARPDHLARYARQVSLLLYFNQDADSAQRWAALSVAAEPTLPWPDAVGMDHPFRTMVEGVEIGFTTGPEARYFAVPKKGAVFYNGNFAATPVAVSSTPGFWQMTDKRGNLVNAWWQDGTAFPSSVLTAEGEALTAPKSWTGAPPLDPVLVSSSLTFQVPERQALELPEPEPEPEPDAPQEEWPEDDLDFEYIDDDVVEDATPAPEDSP